MSDDNIVEFKPKETQPEEEAPVASRMVCLCYNATFKLVEFPDDGFFTPVCCGCGAAITNVKGIVEE